mgnify:CR=1 FL=1
MQQYLNLLRHVMDNGEEKSDRTGTGTRSVFGHQMRFDLAESFPLLTTKKVHFNSVIRELLWYLSGETHIRNLREHTKIWDAWTSEEKNWEIGKMYGYQWVKWEKFFTNPKTGEITKTHINQIKEVIDLILEYKIDGVILTNTTDVNRKDLFSSNKLEKGGLSGKPLRGISTKLIRRFYKDLKGKALIIGVGGIDSGNSAFEKIAAGASALQIYTGMVYRGHMICLLYTSDAADE